MTRPEDEAGEGERPSGTELDDGIEPEGPGDGGMPALNVAQTDATEEQANSIDVELDAPPSDDAAAAFDMEQASFTFGALPPEPDTHELGSTSGEASSSHPADMRRPSSGAATGGMEGQRDGLAKTGDDQAPPRTLIAIASGRGGAGKSLLAANMAVYLAQIGKRVVAVDADPAGGTLNHLLGTPRPGRGFATFLRGRAETLDELAIDTPVAGVRLVAGEAPPFGSSRPKVNSKVVLAALEGINADVVVLDLGPPDAVLTLDLWLGAHVPIVVTLSDSASIEATYRFLKSAFLRQLRGERGLDKLQAQVGRTLPAALDLYRVALEMARQGSGQVTSTDGGRAAPPDEETEQGQADLFMTVRGGSSTGGQTKTSKLPAAAAGLAQAIARFRPRFVVTQTRSLGDTKLGPQMAMAAHRRLGHGFDYLGHVETDETVAAATRRHRPVMAEFPEAKVCRNIEKIVRRVLSSETERPPQTALPRLESEQTFYEILETEPGVSDEEIRRAFRLCREIYAPGSPVIAGLYEEAELTAFHERVNAAHDTLFAPERRRLYDLSLPEADLARAVRRAAQTARVEPAASAASPVSRTDRSGAVLVVDAETEISGPTLRRVRESRGMELSEVAQRTKISERHLRSIEEERFDELPAPVYVRGFVSQIARMLQIDPTRAAETYLRRFRGAMGPGAGTPVLKEI